MTPNSPVYAALVLLVLALTLASCSPEATVDVAGQTPEKTAGRDQPRLVEDEPRLVRWEGRTWNCKDRTGSYSDLDCFPSVNNQIGQPLLYCSDGGNRCSDLWYPSELELGWQWVRSDSYGTSLCRAVSSASHDVECGTYFGGHPNNVYFDQACTRYPADACVPKSELGPCSAYNDAARTIGGVELHCDLALLGGTWTLGQPQPAQLDATPTAPAPEQTVDHSDVTRREWLGTRITLIPDPDDPEWNIVARNGEPTDFTSSPAAECIAKDCQWMVEFLTSGTERVAALEHWSEPAFVVVDVLVDSDLEGLLRPVCYSSEGPVVSTEAADSGHTLRAWLVFGWDESWLSRSPPLDEEGISFVEIDPTNVKFDQQSPGSQFRC